MKHLGMLLFFAGLIASTIQVRAATYYVNVSNTVPATPFNSWGSAATNIQDAVDVSTDGDFIWVSNGVYSAGGRFVYGSLSNRVVINKAVVVQSVNGPAKTSIQGNFSVGDNAIRCVYMTNGAVLIGFTLNNGTTRYAGDSYEERSGGGIWCESVSAVISNCIVARCSANLAGGGAVSGTFFNSTLTNNTAGSYGGGALGAILTNCVITRNTAIYGGGVCSNTLYGCKVTNNWATLYGGGAYSCGLSNCTLFNNSAKYGGGAVYGTLTSCTVSNNTAYNGGGVVSNTLNNCLVTDNGATNAGGGSFWANMNGCTVSHNGAATNGGAVYGGNLVSCMLLTNIAENYGGGSFYANLTNCNLIANYAGYGGGAAGGVCVGCNITNNVAFYFGGGVISNTAYNCLISSNSPGGSYYSTLNGCWITWNWYGGSQSDTLNNCIIEDNFFNGNGAYLSTLNNCTVSYNGTITQFYGVLDCNVTNSIVYNNFPGHNYQNGMFSGLAYCCTTPLPPGAGNFTNAPLFLDAIHQQSNSPCIDAGNTSVAAGSVDFDGRPRVVGGAVDVGATEYQGAATEPFVVWLAQYNLPDNGSADYADSDGNGMNNWQKWVAGLNPTNKSSVLKMSLPVFTNKPAGVVVRWQSVTNITYYIQRSSSLAAGSFSSIQSNILGQAGMTSFTDTTTTNANSSYYRVGVQ